MKGYIELIQADRPFKAGGMVLGLIPVYRPRITQA
jgi:hypothetical protein